MPDEPITPVLFRVHRAPVKYGAEVTAVFPCEPADFDGNMTCYTHVGQHGGCSLDWYRQTRPARPNEYTDLKAELEAEPYGYRFRVYQKITPKHRSVFRAERRRLMAM